MTHIPSFFFKLALTAGGRLAITTGPLRVAVGVVRVGGNFKIGSVTDDSFTWSTSEEVVATAWIDSTRHINAKKTFKALNITLKICSRVNKVV
jgi:hypothetical protein